MALVKSEKNSGFVALITAIILSAILLIITTTLNQTSFFTRGTLLDSEYKERSTALAEACVDVARLKIANDPTYSGDETLNIGSDSCHIRPISGSTIETEAVFQGAYTNLQVGIGAPPGLDIVSWVELENF